MVEFQLFARHCATNFTSIILFNPHNNFARYMCPILLFFFHLILDLKGILALVALWHVGSLVLQPGIDPAPPALEGEVLATGPPGMS